MSDTSPVARLVRISGLVQSVGYRAWTEREARSRGLAGWVRNRLDGTVEALFIGDGATIADMIKVCRIGPRHARVETVRDESVSAQGVGGFQQRETE